MNLRNDKPFIAKDFVKLFEKLIFALGHDGIFREVMVSWFFDFGRLFVVEDFSRNEI